MLTGISSKLIFLTCLSLMLFLCVSQHSQSLARPEEESQEVEEGPEKLEPELDRLAGQRGRDEEGQAVVQQKEEVFGHFGQHVRFRK